MEEHKSYDEILSPIKGVSLFRQKGGSIPLPHSHLPLSNNNLHEELNPHLMITSLRDLTTCPHFNYFTPPTFQYSSFRGAHLSMNLGNAINQYTRLYDIKRQRRMRVNSSEYVFSLNAYLRFLTKIESSFGHLFSQLDVSTVLPATAPLGFVRPNHYDMDEKGIFGIKRSFRFPQELVDFTIKQFTPLLDPSDVHLSMKRGTNLGWPTPKGGRSRDESDLLLMLHAAYVSGCKQSHYTLLQAYDQLQSLYGTGFTIAGERFQETERILPNIYEDCTIISKGGSLRTRGIYFSPKFMVIWNRPVVKTVLTSLLRSPHHSQDRAFLKEHLTKNWEYSLSVDVSAFDQSFGNGAQQQAHTIIAQLAEKGGLGDWHRIFNDLETEFNVKNIIPTAQATYISTGGNILSSGLAATSLIGTFTSHMLLYELVHRLSGLSYQTLAERHLSDWIGLSWGDDVVVCFSKEMCKLLYDRLPKSPDSEDFILDNVKRIGADLQLKLDSEPTLKFLGQYYNFKNYNSNTPLGAIPVGRWIQRQFFPERIKLYPFDRIGYIARLYMLSEMKLIKEVHSICQRDFGIGKDVTISGDSIRDLAPFVQEIVKYADSIKELDDIINTFTHGLDIFDMDSSLADVFGEEFVAVLGQSELDLTDIKGLLDDKLKHGIVSSNMYRDMRSLNDKPSPVQFQSVVREIARLYNDNNQPLAGDLYY